MHLHIHTTQFNEIKWTVFQIKCNKMRLDDVTVEGYYLIQQAL